MGYRLKFIDPTKCTLAKSPMTLKILMVTLSRALYFALRIINQAGTLRRLIFRY